MNSRQLGIYTLGDNKTFVAVEVVTKCPIHNQTFLALSPSVASSYLPTAGGVGEGDAGHGGADLSQLGHPQGRPARALNILWKTLTTEHRAASINAMSLKTATFLLVNF